MAKELLPPLPVGAEARKEKAEAGKLTVGKADSGRSESQCWASVSDGRLLLEGRVSQHSSQRRHAVLS
jgi:hypothetical protein